MSAPLAAVLFDRPGFLLGLWIVVVLALVAVWRWRRGRGGADRLLHPRQQRRLLPLRGAGRTTLRTLLWIAAIAALFVAAARPRWGVSYQEVERRGADLFVLLDVSRSMLSADLEPNRLERARRDILDLLPHLANDRVGLVAFAGKAVVACPLTHDHGFFRQALREASPRTAPMGGTAIGDAIRTALDTMEPAADRDQSLLLITDGEDHDSFAPDAAGRAADRNVRIFTVGLGDSEEGARVPAAETGAETWLKHEGQEVWSKMDESLLRTLAERTDAAYVPARTTDYDLGQVYDEHLADLHRGAFESTRREQHRHRYQWFAGFALLLLVCESWMSPFSRRAVFTASLLLFASLAAHASVDGEEEKSARQLVDEGLGHLAENRFEEAVNVFEVAAERGSAPVIAFDRGVALQRAGRFDEARDAYVLATGGSDPAIAVRARYNLGRLAAERAEERFGNAPEAADGKTRDEGTALIEEAIHHFRRTLEQDPTHEDARHNLELLRLWLQHMEDVWRQRDQQEQQQEDGEQDLFSLLSEIFDEQDELQQKVAVASAMPDSPLRREESTATGEAQHALAGRWAGFAERAEAEVLSPPTPPGSGAAPPPSSAEQEQALALLREYLEQGRAKMDEAAAALTEGDFARAAAAQREVEFALSRWWAVMAQFPAAVQGSLRWQEEVLEPLTQWRHGMPPTTTVDEEDPSAADPTTTDPGVSPLAPGEQTAVQRQSRIAQAATLFEAKGQQLIASMQAALEQAQAAPGGPAGGAPSGAPPGPGGHAPDPEELRAQIDAFQRALEKAREHAPRIAERSSDTLAAVADEDPHEAVEAAEEVRQLLEEILAEMPPQEPQEGSGDSEENQDEQEEPSDEGENEESGTTSPRSPKMIPRKIPRMPNRTSPPATRSSSPRPGTANRFRSLQSKWRR